MTKEKKEKPKRIQQHLLYILSDSTGELGIHQVFTMLSQFPPNTFKVELYNFLESDGKWVAVLKSALKNKAIVLHSTREIPKKSQVAKHIPAPLQFDLTGPLMDFLSSTHLTAPQIHEDKIHEMDDYYYSRVDAIEFAFNHDDSKNANHLQEADVILVGLSRTSKTPVALYLANKGFKVSNISLTLEAGMPTSLENYKGKNVVGLRISLSRLLKKRERRSLRLGISGDRYSEKEYVSQEIRFANKVFSDNGWPVIDISFSSIEETSWKIISQFNLTSKLKYLSK